MRTLYSLLTLILLATAAQAQVKTFTANVDIRANIIQQLEVITVKSMDVEQSSPGQLEIFIDPLNNSNAGAMISIGTPEADIRVSFTSYRELINTEGEGMLIFTYLVSGNTEDNQQTSELLSDGGRVLQLNQEGRYYIWIGGRINLEQAQPGNYEGDFTIEIEYI